jgi:hypothetical protein
MRIENGGLAKGQTISAKLSALRNILFLSLP